MRRTPWITAAFIYNLLAGLVDVIVLGFPLIFLGAVSQDIIKELQAPDVPIASIALALGIVYVILLGIPRLAVLYSLWTNKTWARITTIVLHGIATLVGIVEVVLIVWYFAQIMVSTGMAFALIPLLVLGLNVAFVIGLLFQRKPAGAPQGPTIAAAPPGPMAAPSAPMPPTSPPPAKPPVVSPTQQATGSAMPNPGHGRMPGGGVAKTELANPEPPVLAWLVERGGIRDGREHRLKEDVVIGRDPSKCSVVVDDNKVSGQHARIRMENDQFVIYDLASVNHTFVGGKEVQKHVLQDGEEIRLGTNVRLSFMRVAKP